MSIFINYRISDCSRDALNLYKRLQKDLGVDIFLDKQEVRAGTYWEDEIKQKLLDAQIVLALISSTWLQAKDKSGNLRLKQPNDWVRMEIEQALKEEKLVCVYLKSKEHLPDLKEQDLPKSIQGITKIQNVRLSDESDGHSEAGYQLLLQELRYKLKQDKTPPHPKDDQVAQVTNTSNQIFAGYATGVDTLLTSTHCLDNATLEDLNIYVGNTKKPRKAVEILGRDQDVVLLKFTPALPNASLVNLATGSTNKSLEWTAKAYRRPRMLLKRPSTPDVSVKGELGPVMGAMVTPAAHHQKICAGLSIFSDNYLLGIVRKKPDLNEALSISKPKTWLKTSSLRKYLGYRCERPVGWTYIKEQAASKPAFHFDLYLSGDESNPLAKLVDQSGHALYRDKAIFEEPPELFNSALALAKAFDDGSLHAMLNTNLMATSLQWGYWLTQAIFGQTPHKQHELLKKAGWGDFACLSDRAVSINIYIDNDLSIYEALPWRCLATPDKQSKTHKLHVLTFDCQWQISLITDRSAHKIKLKEDAHILLVKLFDCTGPMSSDLSHADSHFSRIKDLIKHTETQRNKSFTFK